MLEILENPCYKRGVCTKMDLKINSSGGAKNIQLPLDNMV
jgi:hypothetical protein